MVYVVTVGQVLLEQGDSWQSTARTMRWWIRETLMSHNPDDNGFGEKWTAFLAAFDAHDARVRRGDVKPAWSAVTPAHLYGALPVEVKTVDHRAVEHLPYPGRLALVRQDNGEPLKCRVVSCHAGLMTSHVRITARRDMPSQSRRVRIVPWAQLLPRV